VKVQAEDQFPHSDEREDDCRHERRPRVFGFLLRDSRAALPQPIDDLHESKRNRHKGSKVRWQTARSSAVAVDRPHALTAAPECAAVVEHQPDTSRDERADAYGGFSI
jgi:hypothetical protein